MYLIKLLMGWTIRVKNPGRCKRIFLFSETPDRVCFPLNLLANVTCGSFLGNKSAGAWGWPLTFTTAELKNERCCNSTPSTDIHGVCRNNFILFYILLIIITSGWNWFTLLWKRRQHVPPKRRQMYKCIPDCTVLHPSRRYFSQLKKEN